MIMAAQRQPEQGADGDNGGKKAAREGQGRAGSERRVQEFTYQKKMT